MLQPLWRKELVLVDVDILVDARFDLFVRRPVLAIGRRPYQFFKLFGHRVPHLCLHAFEVEHHLAVRTDRHLYFFHTWPFRDQVIFRSESPQRDIDLLILCHFLGHHVEAARPQLVHRLVV